MRVALDGKEKWQEWLGWRLDGSAERVSGK
jgi:hypothetical protein